MFHSRFIVGHLNLLILVIQNRYLTPLGFIVNLFGERPLLSTIPYNADTDAPVTCPCTAYLSPTWTVEVSIRISFPEPDTY